MKRFKPDISSKQQVKYAWVGSCEAGDTKLMEVLLPMVQQVEGGIDCTDQLGITGLMAALEKGQFEVVDRLLDHDPPVDITVEDHRGNTALDYVLRSKTLLFLDEVLEKFREVSECFGKF